MMNRASLLALPCLLLAACGAPPPPDDGATSIEGMKIGAPFTLTDQDGKARTWDSFAGKYRIVYFGYSYCPDVCPLDLQQIMQGYAAFAKDAPDRAAKVQPIFISLDPQRDTPEKLKTYVTAFGPGLVGLTGSPATIAKVAKDFAVYFNREPASGPQAGYLVAHSRTPYLFGPAGQPLALVPVDDPATPEQEGKPDAITAFLNNRIR